MFFDDSVHDDFISPTHKEVVAVYLWLKMLLLGSKWEAFIVWAGAFFTVHFDMTATGTGSSSL